ncbi:MAG: hypothetical protein K2X50_07505 [Gammaproteobacteria bacterium]|nr:hypothetical protein [Gammaproteobacteria bacterium]
MKKGLLRLRPNRTGSSAGVADQGTSSPPESPKNGAPESPRSDSNNSNPINDIKLKLDELSLKGKIILNLSFQFLYYVLDDTQDLPVPTIQEFRARKEPFREYLKTRKGRLLLALVTTPSFCTLFDDEHAVDESKVNKSAKKLADEAMIRQKLDQRHTQVRTNIFLDGIHKPCIPEGLLQTTPGCTSINDHFFYNDPRGSHVVSGIHSPFRANESVVNNFVKISALLVEIAKTILACNEVRHLAQENDKIFASKDSVEQILLLMESFTQLCTEADKCRTELSKILAARVRGHKDKKVNEIPEDTPWKKNMAQIFSGERNKNKQLSTTSSECLAIIKTAESLLKTVETKTPRKKLSAGPREKFVKATAQLNEHIAQFLHPRPPAPSYSPPMLQNTHEAQGASLSKSNGSGSPRDPQELERELASKEKRTLFGKLRSMSEKRLTKKPLTSDKDLEKDAAESTATTLAETDAPKSQDPQTTAQKQGQFAKGRSVSVKNISARPFRQEVESDTTGTPYATITLGRSRTGSMLSQKIDTGTASPGSTSPRDDADAPKVDQRSIKTKDMKQLWASRESSGGGKDSPFLARNSGTISPRSNVTTSNPGKVGSPETSPRTASIIAPQSPTSAKKESPRVVRSGTANSTTATPASPPQQRGTPTPAPRSTAPTSQADKPGSQTAGLKSEQPNSMPTSSSTTASPPQQRGTPTPAPRSTAPTSQANPKESSKPESTPTSPSLTRPRPPTNSPPPPPSQQGKQEEKPPEDKKEPTKTVQTSTSPRVGNQEGEKQEKPADKQPAATVVVTTAAAQVSGDVNKLSDPKAPSSNTEEKPKQGAAPAKIDPPNSPKKTELTDSSAISPRSANPGPSDTGGVDKNSIKKQDMMTLWAQKTGGTSPTPSRKNETTDSSKTSAPPQAQEPPPREPTKPAEESKTKPEIAANNSALPTSELAPPPSDKEEAGKNPKEPTSPKATTASNGRQRAGTGPEKTSVIKKPAVPTPVRPGATPDPAVLSRLSAAKKANSSGSPPTSPRAEEPSTQDTKIEKQPDEALSAKSLTVSSSMPTPHTSSSLQAQKGSDQSVKLEKETPPKPGDNKNERTNSQISNDSENGAISSAKELDEKDQRINSGSLAQQTSRPATIADKDALTDSKKSPPHSVIVQPISKDQPDSQENTTPAHTPVSGLTSQSPGATTKQSNDSLHVVTGREKEALREKFLGGGPGAIGRVAKKTTFTAIGPNVSGRRQKQPQKVQSLEEVIQEAEQLSAADAIPTTGTMSAPGKTPKKTPIEFFQKFTGTPDKPGKLHTNENIQEILTALEDNREHEIVLLQNNDIGAYGALKLYTELSQQKKLKILCMSNNTRLFHALNDIESKGMDNTYASVFAFRDFLATHPTLEHLKIDECGLGPFGASILANGLKSNKSLLSLDLRFNDLTNNGLGFICEALMYHPTIESVLISANRLTEEAGEVLLELLRTNNCIINLDFFEDADSFDPSREKIENYFSTKLTDNLKVAIKENQQKARASPENK